MGTALAGADRDVDKERGGRKAGAVQLEQSDMTIACRGKGKANGYSYCVGKLLASMSLLQRPH